jgi:hypothetical protein
VPAIKPVDWIRAGALTAGVATLLAIWWQGLDRLGYIDWPEGFDATFIVSIAISVAIGATLGHREPRPLWLRVPLAFVVAVAFGAALIGLAFGLSVLGFRERNLPPVYLVLAAGLIAWGLRRLPVSKGARIAFVVVFALLAAVRLMATFTGVARAIERKLFPLPPELVRAEWEKGKCGWTCQEGRTRAVDFPLEIAYEWEQSFALMARATVKPTIEVAKSFYMDGCNHPHDKRPEVPPALREYKTTGACIDARPRPRIDYQTPTYDTDCCYIDGRERPQGERFPSSRIMLFAFTRLKWKSMGDADPPHRRGGERRHDP